MNIVCKTPIKKACSYASLFLIFLFSCTPKETDLSAFQKLEITYKNGLEKCISDLSLLEKAKSIEEAKSAFVAARKQFKLIEPVLALVDASNYEALNGPNLPRVSEEDLTDIKVREPMGFQVLEEMIFMEETALQEFSNQAHFTLTRLQLILNNTSLRRRKKHHFLWIMRDAFIRTATLGITGFDSPALSASLDEAVIVYESLAIFLSYFENEFQDKNLYNELQNSIKSGVSQLKNQEFDSFDRYQFIKTVTNPQLALIKKTFVDWEVENTLELAISNDADNLFSRSTFNIDYFKNPYSNDLKANNIALGKALFYDPNLSKDGSMSCSTCHKSELAFSDGLKTSIGNNGDNVKRNAPTLLYAAYQKGFFYDKRVGELEGQIQGVMLDEHEFHTDFKNLQSYISSDSTYRDQFENLYTDGVNESNIQNAIANYIRSLTPFQSKFDLNMRAEANNLSKTEIQGFNLFMGKAACATCHFPPLFNGLLPTRYHDSEMESLGIPKTAENKEIDDDLGRFELFGTPERKYFFKTPTIRNIVLTAPYMHNGVYDSLQQVMDFYNAGGGQGLGLDVPFQTLPPDSLGLSESEISAIIAFMNTLTDPIDSY